MCEAIIKHRQILLKAVDDLRKEVTCTICLELYTDPISLYCNHTFCTPCYKTLFIHSTIIKSVPCPLCKQDSQRRFFTPNEQIEAVVKTVEKYTEIISKSWLGNVPDELISENMKRIFKSQEKKKAENVKVISDEKRKVEYISISSNEKKKAGYVYIPVKNRTILRKAQSLDCLITKVKSKNPKSYSLGSDTNLSKDENVFIDQYDSPNQMDQLQSTEEENDRKILDLMEEDCLANIENEYVSKIQNKSQNKNMSLSSFCGSSISTRHNTKKNKSYTSITTDPSTSGWTRMKFMKRTIDKKDKKLKQLNITTFSTCESKTKIFSNLKYTAENENFNNFNIKKSCNESIPIPFLDENTSNNSKETISIEKNLKNMPVFQLDQFEAYLEKNLEKSSENIVINQDIQKQNNQKHKFLKKLNESIKNQDTKKHSPQKRKKMFAKTCEAMTKDLINESDNQNKKMDLVKSNENIINIVHNTKKHDYTDKTYLESSTEDQNYHNKENNDNNFIKISNTGMFADKILTEKVAYIDNNVDDDIFDICTQKLKCNLYTNPEIPENLNKYVEVLQKPEEQIIELKSKEPKINEDIFEMCNQKLSKSVDEMASFETIYKQKVSEISVSIPDEKTNYNSKKRKMMSSEVQDVIIDCISNTNNNEKQNSYTLKNSIDTDVMIISNTEDSNEIIRKVMVHRSNLNKKVMQDSSDIQPNTKMYEFENYQIKEKNILLPPSNEVITTLNKGVITSHNIAEELLSFLSSSRSLFSTPTQEKNITGRNITEIINKMTCNKNELGISDVQSLPDFPVSEDKVAVTFYNTAIPYLNNLRKLYANFKLFVEDITTNTKMLSEVFGVNSESLNELISKNEKNENIFDFPSTGNIPLFPSSKENKCDVSIQTECKISCPKCSHSFALELINSKIMHENDFDFCSFDLTNKNFVNEIALHSRTNDKSQKLITQKKKSPLKEIQNISVGNQVEKQSERPNVSNNEFVEMEIKNSGTKVNRRLQFSQQKSQTERNFKRIRKQSSDSDSDSGIQKKTRMFEVNKYINNNIDVQFDSELSEHFTETQNNKNTVTSEGENIDEYNIQKLFDKYNSKTKEHRNRNERPNVTQDVTSKYISILEREYKDIGFVNIQSKKNLNNDIENIMPTLHKDDKEQTALKILTNECEKTRLMLEREFNEVSFTRSNIPEPIPENNVEKHSTSLNSCQNFVLDNLFVVQEKKITSNKCIDINTENKEIDSQLSVSLFTASDNKFRSRNKNNSLQILEKQKKTSLSNEQLSLSLFTNNDFEKSHALENPPNLNKTCLDETVHLNQICNLSPKDIFEDPELNDEVEINLSAHIVDDSLDGCNDIFNDVNIVESTPQKDIIIRRSIKKLPPNITPNLSELPIVETDNDFDNTDWVHDIAPPPEFQDSATDQTKDLVINPKTKYEEESKNTLDLLSCTKKPSRPQILNERIDDDTDDEEVDMLLQSFCDSENVNELDSSKHNVSIRDFINPVSKKLAKSEFTPSEDNTSGNFKNFLEKEISNSSLKCFNPISLVQQDKISPLTIVKTTNNIPKAITCSTPKQKSILSYMKTPCKNNESISSSASICVIPQVQSVCNRSFDERMDLTPVPEKNQIISVSPKRKPCIACTRLNKEENLTIVAMTTKYNLVYSKLFNKSVTHLIVLVDDKNRIRDHTIKYISAVASGIWIVSFTWVQDCLTYGRLMPEEPYEVLDVSGVSGPKRSRLTRKSNPLLKNFIFHCADPFISVSKNDLQNVVTDLGGEIVQVLSDLKKKPGKNCLILTEAKISQDFEQYQVWLETLQILTVDIEWLSRSVGQYQISSVRPFVLCLEEGIENLGYPSSLIAIVPDTLSEFTNTHTMRE